MVPGDAYIFDAVLIMNLRPVLVAAPTITALRGKGKNIDPYPCYLSLQLGFKKLTIKTLYKLTIKRLA